MRHRYIDQSIKENKSPNSTPDFVLGHYFTMTMKPIPCRRLITKTSHLFTFPYIYILCDEIVYLLPSRGGSSSPPLGLAQLVTFFSDQQGNKGVPVLSPKQLCTLLLAAISM
jgi:hypothetical protein